MKNRIFRIIVPAVLAGIALALSLYRIFLSAGGGEDSFSMTAVPVAAALLLAHSVWERPRAGSYLLLGISFLLPELGVLSGLPLLSRGGRDFWQSLQPYLSTPYQFHQFKSIGVTLDIFLIAAYASLLILTVEAFIGKDFLSRFVSFVTFAGFTAYAVYYLIQYGNRIPALTAACSYLPHILICAAAVLLCLRKAEKAPREPAAAGPEDGPDYGTLRDMLLELKRMRKDGALSEAAYAEKRGKLLEKL